MLITTTAEINQITAKGRSAGVVALDTEFFLERTFYPKLGLIQLAIDETSYLIDPLAVSDFTPLGDLLSDPTVVKIFHDAPQDLILLHRATGALPKNIFDTRLAYGFCGGRATLSLADLLEILLDIKLSKTESRTNWLQRPLTGKQLEYAADDVRYLSKARQVLIDMAEQRHTVAWLQEEMTIYEDKTLYADAAPEAYFDKIRGRERLNRRQLALLYELSRWREQQARHRNRPRGHIISNRALYDIARQMPQQLEELPTIRHLHPREAQRYGNTIIKLVTTVMEKKEEELPPRIKRLRHHPESKKILAAIAQAAEKLQLDPALLCSTRQLNALLHLPQSARNRHPLLNGWRKEVILQFDDKQLIQTITGNAI